jgi:restriction system protein
VLSDLEARLLKDRNSINKYEIVRTVLERLNSKGEPALRERREILRRVTEFEDFSTCWPSDQLKTKGLVGEISRVIGVKDSFTRMKQAQEEERKVRLAEQHNKVRAAAEGQPSAKSPLKPTVMSLIMEGVARRRQSSVAP